MSVQSAAAQQRLRWDPVIPTGRCDPDAFDFQWRRIQFLFQDVPDPRTFPLLPESALPPEQVEVLRQFRRRRCTSPSHGS